uniref:BPTI/Kunitz inhibitor domain-containing protein n=1 Tax=Anolis carolinensis TaxID=28377 RepID=H9G9K1_ANOCA
MWAKCQERILLEHAFPFFLLDLCLLPPNQGDCYAYMPRFFYNSTSGKCEKFIYGGCGGNENNFMTREECYYACIGTGERDTDGTAGKAGSGTTSIAGKLEPCDAPGCESTGNQYTEANKQSNIFIKEMKE